MSLDRAGVKSQQEIYRDKCIQRDIAAQTGAPLLVMAGLVPPVGPEPLRRGEGPAIHVFLSAEAKTWMPGTRPGMTN